MQRPTDGVPVTARLVNGDTGATAATTTVAGLTTEWKLYNYADNKSAVATNFISHPNAVVWVEHTIDVAGPRFDTFEPYPVNMLDLSY